MKMKLPKGFFIAGINCGIKKSKRDLGIIIADDLMQATGVFTKNLY